MDMDEEELLTRREALRLIQRDFQFVQANKAAMEESICVVI
jgi:hypothetical protein